MKKLSNTYLKKAVEYLSKKYEGNNKTLIELIYAEENVDYSTIIKLLENAKVDLENLIKNVKHENGYK